MLRKAEAMFPEGVGAPRAFIKDGGAAEKTNELLENATAAIELLFERRGYNPKHPEEVKAKLGYALDRYEAAAYLVTGAMHLPLLSQPEAWTIGKRIKNIIGESGPVGSKLKALRKRGKPAAAQVTALLLAPSTLNLASPPRKGTAPSAPSAPPPLPPVPPQPLLPPTEQPCTRTAIAAATPLQKLFGVPNPAAWGPDEDDMPAEGWKPVSPDAPAAARAELSTQWVHSREAAHAIQAALDLEDRYSELDGGCSDREVEIEVATVRYKHALLELRATIPADMPEIVLEPQMANEHNSMPCPYGFGRLVRKPWALHLQSLGFCDYECLCGVGPCLRANP